MSIKLQSPLIITSRLMPGVRFDNFTVSLDVETWTGIYIDFHGDAEGTEEIHEGGFTFNSLPEDTSEAVRSAMGTVLGFMGAFTESIDPRFAGEGEAFGWGENSDMFPERFKEWAWQESDEIGMACYELEHDEEEDA